MMLYRSMEPPNISTATGDSEESNSTDPPTGARPAKRSRSAFERRQLSELAFRQNEHQLRSEVSIDSNDFVNIVVQDQK